MAFSSSHHYSTNKADTSATISIRYNVTIAYTQKGDSDKPKTVEYVSKFLIMIPEELYNIYQIFLNKQIIEPGNILNQYIYILYISGIDLLLLCGVTIEPALEVGSLFVSQDWPGF